MNPKDLIDLLQRQLDEEQATRRAKAMKYIEDNVDLIDVDLQEFMDNCPDSCHLEVYEMLLKAGIDMKDYVVNNTLKHFDKYIHDTSPLFHPYYTVDCSQKWDTTKTIKWEPDRLSDCIVLDTISAVEEA